MCDAVWLIPIRVYGWIMNAIRRREQVNHMALRRPHSFQENVFCSIESNVSLSIRVSVAAVVFDIGSAAVFVWLRLHTATQCTTCDHSCWNVTNEKCNNPCGFGTNRTYDHNLITGPHCIKVRIIISENINTFRYLNKSESLTTSMFGWLINAHLTRKLRGAILFILLLKECTNYRYMLV